MSKRVYKLICGICGKSYDSKSPKRKICYDDHYQTCPDCGTNVVWNSLNPFYGCKSCNQKRAVIKRRATLLERYGVTDVFKSEEFKAKSVKTSLERYGVSNPNKSPEIRNKIKATCLERYGVDSPMKVPEIIQKVQNKRSGQQEQIACKQKMTMLDRYGVLNPMDVPEFVDKIADTMTERYGVKSAVMVPEFKEKLKATNRERYGVDYYVQTSKCRESQQGAISKTNTEFGSMLESLGYNVTYEYPIGTKSYDIALLDKKILIELDPSYTHNSAKNHWSDNGIDKNYHAEKTAIAESNGFRCIHVFDWDSEIAILRLLSNRDVVYARNCSISEVSVDDANAFINSNHIQGSCRGTIYAVGLFSHGALVQVMTFGKPRYNKSYSWELLRLCTACGVQVVGGASKLFKYCVTNYNLNNIISYCDRAKFTGRVYEQIGMTYQYTSTPNVHWSKRHDHISGSLLRQRGYDQLFNANYGKGTSNDELMLQNGWLPVYDCGQAVYTYKANNGSSDMPIEILDYDDLLKQREERKKVKNCAYCGKEFRPNSSRQIYCAGPHYQTCPVCGKSVLVTNNDKLKHLPTACSYACRQVRIQQTCLDKYGVNAPGAIPSDMKMPYTRHKKDT